MNNKPSKRSIVNSKSIMAYDYDHNTYKLNVIFTDGNEYEYDNVMPDTLSKVFDSPGSVGKKFKQLIAKSHKYQKV